MEPVPLYLAPMAGVTDLPFRLLAKECGADITVTEFTAAAGLNRDDARSWRRLESDPREFPFIPQIFGGIEEEMVGTTRALSSVADVIDLNFGCPAPKVCRNSAGAALLGDPDKLVSMVRACIEASEVPVSVKVRLGTGSGPNTAHSIASRLQDEGVFRIAVHGRTLRQRYAGNADWEEIGEMVRNLSIPVVANGDVKDIESASQCLEVTGAAGLMIGRAAIGNPDIFFRIKNGLGWTQELPPWSDLESRVSFEGRNAAIKLWCWKRYCELANETYGGRRNTHLKRHAISFTKGLEGASEMRVRLHRTQEPEQLIQSVTDFLESSIKSNEIIM
jgi:tRNA-dihydrouridine synthase B